MRKNETVRCRRCGLEFVAAEDEVGSCPVCGGPRTLKPVEENPGMPKGLGDRHPNVIWLAWAIRHDAHGPSMDNLVFLPEGDRPETEGDWVRVPWLDSPPLGEPEAGGA